jgi:serine protease Do
MSNFNIDKKSVIIGVLAGALVFSSAGGNFTKNVLDETGGLAKKYFNIFGTVTAASSKVTIGEKDNFTELNKDYKSPIVKIAEEVGPSVVGVVVKAKVATTSSYFDPFSDLDPFGDDEGSSNNQNSQTEEGSGSGIIFNEDGYILTNNHVVTMDSDKVADDIQVILHDSKNAQKKYTAKVVGRDPQTDLAVLKISGAKDLTVAEFGNSDDLKVGDLSVAIGNPLGEEFAGTVTTGYVSALNRKVQLDDREFNLIQTDAAINSGNSGGALVNAHGEVIGINSAKLQATGVEGIGFAIPINQAKSIARELIDKGKVSRPQLGIYTDTSVAIDDNLSKTYNLPKGVYVSSVVKNSGADKAGIKAKDIITEINGTKVESLSALRNEIQKNKIGDTVTLTVYREGKSLKVKVTLIESTDK